MGLILLESLAALVLLLGIVWWTMFSGRKRGEWQAPPDQPSQSDAPAPSLPASPEPAPAPTQAAPAPTPHDKA